MCRRSLRAPAGVVQLVHAWMDGMCIGMRLGCRVYRDLDPGTVQPDESGLGAKPWQRRSLLVVRSLSSMRERTGVRRPSLPPRRACGGMGGS